MVSDTGITVIIALDFYLTRNRDRLAVIVGNPFRAEGIILRHPLRKLPFEGMVLLTHCRHR